MNKFKTTRLHPLFFFGRYFIRAKNHSLIRRIVFTAESDDSFFQDIIAMYNYLFFKFSSSQVDRVRRGGSTPVSSETIIRIGWELRSKEAHPFSIDRTITPRNYVIDDCRETSASSIFIELLKSIETMIKLVCEPRSAPLLSR